MNCEHITGLPSFGRGRLAMSLLLMSLCVMVHAQRSIRMAEVYSDSMVLQRDAPLTISGTSKPGSKITLTIADRRATGKADRDGRWSVHVRKMSAGGPYIMNVTDGDETLTFRDVMIGEVWLCSGQSNMEFTLRQCDEFRRGEVSLDPNETAPMPIRIYNPRPVVPTSNIEWDEQALQAVNAKDYLSHTSWTGLTATTAPGFSAVAYFFGKMLQEELHVPIGLINNSVGGTNAEGWISRRSLEREFPEILDDWVNNPLIQDWCAERARKNLALAIRRDEKELHHPYEPTYMFESATLPLDRYGIRGVIWYQGESNAHNTEAHGRLFEILVKDWRDYWHDGDMPFLFVQLSSLNRPTWPEFRDSQRRLSYKIRHTGMAVTSDVGDSTDVHPRVKRPVGERLARLALADVYSRPFYVTHPSARCGPMIRKATLNDNGLVILSFDYADGLSSSDGKPLRTFEVIDPNGNIYPARASIVDEQIYIISPASTPVAVRYGWQPFTRANLVNAYGLPASTFVCDVD